MLNVAFYEETEDQLLKFAVIIAKTNGQWVFCRHRDRTTYEIPGGHRAANETILEAAMRELKEETGAVEFTINPICVYSVKEINDDEETENETFGMLYIADIFTFEAIHSEIESILMTDTLIENWTYPLIQPAVIREALRMGCC